MISLEQYVMNEAMFKSKEYGPYNQHGFEYAMMVIDHILNNDKIRLGANGEEEFDLTQISKEDLDKLESIRQDIEKTSSDTFDNVVSKYGLKWNKIFKGVFSHNEGGNKGNHFDTQFKEKYYLFEDKIKKIFPYESLTGEISLDSWKNQSRPLHFNGDKITVGAPKDDFNIGSTVTDITVPTDKGNIYLSLKYGPKVTFGNPGIKRIFDDKFFNGEPSDNAKALCDMLSIDIEKMRSVFNNYNKDENKNDVNIDITKELSDNDNLKVFLKSMIGCGYVLVHELKGEVHFIDMLKTDKLDDLVKVDKATIDYGGKSGTGKRVDITIENDKIKLLINIRNKQGGVYPTHIMCDYVFKR